MVVTVVYVHVSSMTINYVCEQDGVCLLCFFVTTPKTPQDTFTLLGPYLMTLLKQIGSHFL